MKPLREQTVVITGASSGLGRCTALLLARRGARVAAFARGEAALASLVAEIEAEGGRAVAVTGDVSDPADIDRLARTTVDRFGGIDTWVNNAAVFIQGRVDQIEPDEFRRVIEVNLLGAIYGSRRAVVQMKEQGHGGIIQISSIVGQRGPAFFSPYAASKRGLTGFTEALRTELWGTDIEVSTLYLPALDTPIYQHARAKMGARVSPAPPVYDPGPAAEAIADLAVSPRARKHISWFHLAYTAPHRISPVLGDWFLHRTRGFTRGDEPPGPDNLYEPSRVIGDGIRGGWGEAGWRGFTLREVVRVLPLETAVAFAAAGFLLAGLRR